MNRVRVRQDEKNARETQQRLGPIEERDHTMSLMEHMMGFMMERMSKEDKEAMMDSMMEKFFADITPEEKQKMMTDMMPKTVQGWLSVFSGLLTTAVFSLLAISGYSEAMKKTKYGASIEQGSDMIAVWQSTSKCMRI